MFFAVAENEDGSFSDTHQSLAFAICGQSVLPYPKDLASITTGFVLSWLPVISVT
ncbi:hypothetical protein CEV32_1872 [Brucella rhizosphaerae]|uniref:Uncharacterized protein n=1 Tax=Brucella rhizosphaerae TaxID=571254 RepID=A0A256F3M7_9HYPH|nr:hypothetical protein CEV32_1872 [Brucella rhizosphaerae]